MRETVHVCLGLLTSEISNPKHTRPVGEGFDQGAHSLGLYFNVEVDHWRSAGCLTQNGRSRE